jgi:hypothetical protein
VEKYGTAGQATGDTIIRRVRFACWTIKTTNAHSEYVTLIAFTWQQLLLDCASMLRHAYIASLALFSFFINSSTRYFSIHLCQGELI